MQEFDELKDIWQKSTTAQPENSIPDMSQASAQTKIKLQNEQRNGAISLVFTALFIAGLAIWGGFNFKHWYTYGAMALVCLICLTQAGIMFYLYRCIMRIDQTTPPAEHLRQWETYYAFRQRLFRWNGPVYFILLNLAMGLYLLEVLGRASLQFKLVFGSIYLSWMAFAYFFMGKRVIRKEKRRITDMIADLKQLEVQLKQ